MCYYTGVYNGHAHWCCDNECKLYSRFWSVSNHTSVSHFPKMPIFLFLPFCIWWIRLCKTKSSNCYCRVHFYADNTLYVCGKFKLVHNFYKYSQAEVPNVHNASSYTRICMLHHLQSSHPCTEITAAVILMFCNFAVWYIDAFQCTMHVFGSAHV